MEDSRASSGGEVIRDFYAGTRLDSGRMTVKGQIHDLQSKPRHVLADRRVSAHESRFGSAEIERGFTGTSTQALLGKLRTPLSITFAFVATHNHFVLDRGGKVFNRTAPVIKLPESATEDDHLALLGVLNSSTACFWLKQVSHDKGNRAVNVGVPPDAWEELLRIHRHQAGAVPASCRHCRWSSVVNSTHSRNNSPPPPPARKTSASVAG